MWQWQRGAADFKNNVNEDLGLKHDNQYIQGPISWETRYLLGLFFVSFENNAVKAQMQTIGRMVVI